MKHIFRGLYRRMLASFAMLVAYLFSLNFIGGTNIELTPSEASRVGLALIFVSLANALVLSTLVNRSHWHGWKLMGAVFLVHFGVETGMAQIETLYFNSAVQMSTTEFVGIVAAGALRAAIFSPLVVAIFGKLRKPAQLEKMPAVSDSSRWGIRCAAIAIFYFLVYFTFGYFVAWQFEETRLYYTGSTAIKPFFTHFQDLFLREDPLIIPFQLLRGALWTTLALMILGMIRSKRWEAALIVAFVFAVLFTLPLGLFPNPYMPPQVARSHFLETASSMLLFGGIAGWVLYRRMAV